MSMHHFLYVPFTGLGLKGGFRGNTWLKNRIEVFKRFVLPSLLHQSSRDFTLWVSWRPEEEGNDQVRELARTLSSIRNFRFIFTYNGLCFEDDKFDRPGSITRLRDNLTATLPLLQPLVAGSDRVLMTIQPSDDCYFSHVVETLQKEAEKDDLSKPVSFGYREGYMMNYNTLEIADYARHGWKTDETSTYTTNTIPPFFTVVFPRAVFLDPEAHLNWTGPYRSHEYIGDHTEYHALPGPGFIVGTHGENISTTWTHRYKGTVLNSDEREKVMLQVGMVDVEPFTPAQDSARHLENKIVNYLPRALKRRYVRWRSPGIGSAINGYNFFRL